MSNNNNHRENPSSLQIYQKVEALNNRIDDYNRQLSKTGDCADQMHLIEEIKALHKEVNRMNLQLLPRAYKSGSQ